MNTQEPKSPLRLLLVGAGLAVVLLFLIFRLPRLADPGVLGVDDFVEYWSAGRLNATGGNPYSPDELLRLQKVAGSKMDEAIMMWNPPWTLTYVMPFGLPGYPSARLVWLLFNTFLVIVCADRLWHYYHGPAELRWLSWVLALSFCPTLIVLRMGQIGPLILTGLAGFLLCQERRGWWAGAFFVLSAVKPHLVYLAWVAVLLWSLERRRWAVLLGMGVTGALTVLVPFLFNPEVFAQYRYATSNQPPTVWLTTTFGALARLWLRDVLNIYSRESSALQFVPTLFGLLWFFPYWLKHHRSWQWQQQMPLLLLVSFVTTSFGWLGDQVVLLAALVPMAVWVVRFCPPRWSAAISIIYLLLDSLDLGINAFLFLPEGRQELFHLWTAPTLLIGYLALRRLA